MIVGGGAREHVLSRVYEKSPQVEKIIIVPGNDFIGYNRDKEVVLDNGCSLTNPESILELARKYNPDLVDVAQDNALACGAVDLLRENEFWTFGATKSASRIEWDKGWSREFMKRHGIRHPKFWSFNDDGMAKDYVKNIYAADPESLLYVKAAGLCSGKGALKSVNLEQALGNVEMMKTFGDAGSTFLVEKGLRGEEFSYFAIGSGRDYHIFKSAQDNKTVFNFDEGDQTGGMGAVAPAMITKPFVGEIDREMIAKVFDGMALEGNPFGGVLFLGGIIDEKKLMNIEYNARWGDPECQVVLPSIKTDYVDVVTSCLNGNLGELNIEQDDLARVCVVGASRGYPGDYYDVVGKRIYGLEDVMKMDGVSVFGAGVDVRDGKFYANGGRLFSVVGEGSDIMEASKRAYSAIAGVKIEGNNLHYRTDIGWRDVERFLGKVE